MLDQTIARMYNHHMSKTEQMTVAGLPVWDVGYVVATPHGGVEKTERVADTTASGAAERVTRMGLGSVVKVMPVES